MTRKTLPILLASLAFASAASAQILRTIETAHYTIRTDLPTALADDLARRMDAMYEEYARRLANFNSVANAGNKKLDAYLFANRADYLKLTGEKFPNTGGVFMPQRNLLAAFLEGQGRDTLRRTLQHEAFHQFANAAIGPRLPIWLNEGLAQVFEEGIWTGDHFIVGQVPPRRIRQLRADMKAGRLLPFSDFLFFTDATWAGRLNDKTSAAIQYNQSWAMTHFLIWATDENGSPKYRQRLIQMMRDIASGESAEDAFRGAFSPNITGFQDRFVEWARLLAPTVEATYIENQTVLADLAMVMRDQGLSFDRVVDFQLALEKGGYRLEYTRGDVTWNTDESPSVYFKDIAGKPFGGRDLYFDARPGAPAPDIVCRPSAGLVLRTVFHLTAAKSVEHEIVLGSR